MVVRSTPGTTVTLPSSDTPISIPDNNTTGVTSTLSVGTNLTLTDVNVLVQMTHTYVGDMFIKLRSPLGTEVTLLDRLRHQLRPPSRADLAAHEPGSPCVLGIGERLVGGPAPSVVGDQLTTRYGGRSGR